MYIKWNKKFQEIATPTKTDQLWCIEPSVPRLPCAYPAGVVSSCGQDPFKTTRPYHFAQLLKEGLLATRAALIFSCHTGTLPATKSHLWTSLGEWATTLMNPDPTPEDTYQVLQVIPMMPVHLKWGRSAPLYLHRVTGQGCHGTAITVSASQINGGVTWNKVYEQSS